MTANRRRGSGAKEPAAIPGASDSMIAHPQGEAGPAPMPATTIRPSSAGDEAFDRWLQQGLNRLYDAALSEPVPDSLLRLLRDDSTK